MQRSDLLQFFRAVERHHLHVLLLCVHDERARLARIGVDDALRCDAETENLHIIDCREVGSAHTYRIDLLTRSTVEADAERGEHADDRLVCVALHSVERLYSLFFPARNRDLNIHLDVRQFLLPETVALVQRIDVDEHEGVVIVL